jgi:hypothetical protein
MKGRGIKGEGLVDNDKGKGEGYHKKHLKGINGR